MYFIKSDSWHIVELPLQHGWMSVSITPPSVLPLPQLNYIDWMAANYLQTDRKMWNPEAKYRRLITTCGVGRPKSAYVPNVNNLQPSSHIDGSSSMIMRCMGYYYPIWNLVMLQTESEQWLSWAQLVAPAVRHSDRFYLLHASMCITTTLILVCFSSNQKSEHHYLNYLCPYKEWQPRSCLVKIGGLSQIEVS